MSSWAFKSMTHRSNIFHEVEDRLDNPSPFTYDPKEQYNTSNKGIAFTPLPPPPKPTPQHTTISLLARRKTRKQLRTKETDITHATNVTRETVEPQQPHSTFNKGERDPSKTWLKPSETSNCPYFLNPEKTLLNFGYYNSAPQWGKSKSPRMMVHDYIRGEQGTLSSGPESYVDPNRISRTSDEKAKETYAAFKPGNPRPITTLKSEKLQLRAPTRKQQIHQRLGPQHQKYCSVTCNSIDNWIKEVTTSNEDARNQKKTTMHRQKEEKKTNESVLPKWLIASMDRSTIRFNKKDNKKEKNKNNFKSESKKNNTFGKQQILSLFGTPPHKRSDKLIRAGAMWLRNTAIGSSLSPSLRKKLASGCKLLEIQSEVVLSAEMMRSRKERQKLELPHHVYIVLSGMLKQRCKRRNFETFLVNGDCALELCLLDVTFARDQVTVVAAKSGATVISIPRQLYIDTAREARRRIVMKRIASLKCCALFQDVEDKDLARMALSAKTILTQNKMIICRQNENMKHLYIVLRGTYFAGRCLKQSGTNIYNKQNLTTGEVEWEEIQRSVTPCITVGYKERGGYFGEECVTKGLETKTWATVVCDGPGELLCITPAVLRVIGVELHQQTLQRINDTVSKRPADQSLVLKMSMRQQLQRLKTKLIGDELPI